MFAISACAILVLLAAMLALIDQGRRLARRQLARDPALAPGLGASEGAVFGLLALLVAFTYSGASERFKVRRQLVVAEANSIRTVALRLDLLPAPAQAPLRALLSDYLDARLATFRFEGDETVDTSAKGRARRLQGEIWSQTLSAARAQGDSNITSLVVQPAGEMIEIAATSAAAARTHTSWMIFAVLGALVLGCAFLAGYSLANSRHPQWVAWVFPVVMSVTLYLVLDLEFPRFGLIRIDASDGALETLRENLANGGDPLGASGARTTAP